MRESRRNSKSKPLGFHGAHGGQQKRQQQQRREENGGGCCLRERLAEGGREREKRERERILHLAREERIPSSTFYFYQPLGNWYFLYSKFCCPSEADTK